MTSRSTRRITASLVVSFAIAGSFGPTAGAWIPSVESDEPLSASRSVVLVPDAFERAAKRQTQKLQAASAGPDAFERAVRRGSSGRAGANQESGSRTPPQT